MSYFDDLDPDDTDFADFDRTKYCLNSEDVPYPASVDGFFEDMDRMVKVQLAEESIIDFHFDGHVDEDEQLVFYADVGAIEVAQEIGEYSAGNARSGYYWLDDGTALKFDKQYSESLPASFEDCDELKNIDLEIPPFEAVKEDILP
ncbi:hypothetical protein [Halococcus sediminicola]|uniref:hypothetical protein n=1 Tax=Halococcus sediminicola TaxID=1264579 RepID=UPI000678BB90|nr:hypothetical protein [Halococcus sediminicola]